VSLPKYSHYEAIEAKGINGKPEHWNASRLRFAATLNPSKQEVKGFGEQEMVSFLPMEVIGEDGSLRLENEKEIGECLSGYTYFRDGDVCVAKITPCFENGKGAILRGLKGGIGFGTTELIVARPREEMITPEFLDYLFRSQVFRSLGESEMYGAGGQKRVPESFVRDFIALLPSTDEQKQVTIFLDRETAKIDALIAEQQRLIELLQEKRQAVISHAVTKGLNPNAPMKDSGVEWLGEVPEHWEVLELKRLNAEGSSITYGIVQAGPHQEKGVPYIRTSDMSGDRLLLETCQRTSPEIDEAYARSKVSEGDLVIAIRATVGKTLEVPEELDGANLTQGTAKFSPGERVTSGFMKLAFASSYSQAQIGSIAKGATFLEITLDALRRLAFAVPPKDEAHQITHYLSERCAVLDTLTTNSEEACSLLKERRSALISAAVTGQIDVRGLAEAKAEEK
jgi:type I restriction enzyme S subunit